MAESVTPMMRQYRRIKGEMAEGVVLFFRLGDFYEMFFEDAKTAAPVLDIALTKRNGVPMCGVPFHALDSYLSKLIRAGIKVAICEQVEAASEAKGIVRREVTRVVTPGTVTEDGILDSSRHNFLMGVCREGTVLGLAFLDLSTGLFWGEEADERVMPESMRRYAPTECVMPEGQADDPAFREVMSTSSGVQVSTSDDWCFEYEAARDNMVRHFGVHSLEGFGCEGKKAVVGAAGGVLYYVKEELRRQLGHVRSFGLRSSSGSLLLDEATCVNLDLVPVRGKVGAASLLSVLDVTSTAMGGRTLRDWILGPLTDLAEIAGRHELVEILVKDRVLLRSIKEAFSGIRDLERLVARIGQGNCNARDLLAVGHSLACVPGVKELVGGHASAPMKELGGNMPLLPDLVGLVGGAIADEPPATVRDGGMIRKGYNAELDDLRCMASEGRKWLAEYQASEEKRTGIKNLKVRHNRVFGYYIEVSKGQLRNVPADYTRKQTLVNAERFITPELKDYESRILGAQERAVELEYRIFLEIREAVVKETGRIQEIAGTLARLDVLASLADRAVALGYVRPVMTAGDSIVVKGGRHPVVERMPDAERFVPNDTVLDCRENQLIIITGPNMAGKSTYIRQVALVVIMAQMGSFVPAAEAEVGVVDRVFTRVGASDDLARGRSTFMVEMQETANILNNATARSLIVLDEIGRGTSTFDGISIAWAVAEHLHNSEEVKAKTLFATHYHELTDLALTMDGVKNYNVLVREKDDRVVFLRKIVPGGSDKSYGIQVARLAGMPRGVVERAKEILANLEEGEFGEQGQPRIARRRGRKGGADRSQLELFQGVEGRRSKVEGRMESGASPDI
jgi:DNA mismatch repair protein MutS